MLKYLHIYYNILYTIFIFFKIEFVKVKHVFVVIYFKMCFVYGEVCSVCVCT